VQKTHDRYTLAPTHCSLEAHQRQPLLSLYSRTAHWKHLCINRRIIALLRFQLFPSKLTEVRPHSMLDAGSWSRAESMEMYKCNVIAHGVDPSSAHSLITTVFRWTYNRFVHFHYYTPSFKELELPLSLYIHQRLHIPSQWPEVVCQRSAPPPSTVAT